MTAVEQVHELRKPGDTDAVTFSWADASAGLYGLARVATGLGADGAELPSGLAVVFSGRQPVGAVAVAGADAADAVSASVEEPLRRWTVRGAGELAFELEFTATTPSAELGGRDKVAKAGGLQGYEQVCRVSGTVRVEGRARSVNGLGQRGHAWGNPDWDKIALTRTVGAWFDDGSGVVLGTVRPDGVSAHADEAIWAAALDGERARIVEDPRLSTTTDEAGRQIRAGLELWVGKDDDYPFRGVGEVVTGSTLELGALRLDVAFFRWHVEGRTGSGHYDVIRHA
jgi:hypothetical protein